MGPNARNRQNNPNWKRNLSLRLPAPARANGRVQRLCRRCLEVHGTATTSMAVAWAYRELMLGAPTRNGLLRAARRAMEGVGAIKLHRAATQGRPWVWELSKK